MRAGGQRDTCGRRTRSPASPNRGDRCGSWRAKSLVGVSAVHRYYGPTTGDFLSVDPEVAETQQPYYYAGDDPVNGSDPSGLCAGWGCVGYFAEGVEQGIAALGVTVLAVAAEGTSIASCAVVRPLCAVPIVVSGGLFVGAGALACLSARSFVESGVIANPPRRNVAPGPFGDLPPASRTLGYAACCWVRR